MRGPLSWDCLLVSYWSHVTCQLTLVYAVGPSHTQITAILREVNHQSVLLQQVLFHCYKSERIFAFKSKPVSLTLGI